MIESIVNVWEAIMSAIVGLFTSAQDLFWTAESGSLTFLGTLAIVSVAIGIVLLVVGIIQNFLHFRG